ncbi:hypothetical protein COO60DRAFT_550381 [Scenedesmus sp. NREL 46B-D3]|nr:hypothetical protein COO60DRAFT_550381 [Scenedesmus sp. NREL 46B-D3]
MSDSRAAGACVAGCQGCCQLSQPTCAACTHACMTEPISQPLHSWCWADAWLAAGWPGQRCWRRDVCVCARAEPVARQRSCWWSGDGCGVCDYLAACGHQLGFGHQLHADHVVTETPATAAALHAGSTAALGCVVLAACVVSSMSCYACWYACGAAAMP